MIKKDFLDYNDGKIRLQQANLMMENNNRTQEDVDAPEGLLLLRNEDKIKTRRLPIIHDPKTKFMNKYKSKCKSLLYMRYIY